MSAYDIGVSIVAGGLVGDVVEMDLKEVTYVRGSLGSVYDNHIARNTVYVPRKVVGRVFVTVKDYTSHILNLSLSSCTYSYCSDLLKEYKALNSVEDSCYIEVTDGADSFYISTKGSRVVRLGIPKPEVSSILDKFRELFIKNRR